MTTYTVTTDGMKQCAQCRRLLPRTTEYFYKDSTRPDGLHYWCKECRRTEQTARYQGLLKPKRPYKPPVSVPEGMKRCASCQEIKPATVEYFNRFKGGLYSYCRSCASRKQRAYARNLRDQMLEAYGGSPPKCACCGETHRSFLTLDHIEGGGRLDYAATGSNKAVYQRLKNQGWPPGYQILCHNCNCSKSYLGVCEHTLMAESGTSTIA